MLDCVYESMNTFGETIWIALSRPCVAAHLTRT
jgi:hypothetical protein